jgi:hypothetical protein
METLPHNNLRFANQTVYWSGTDTYDRWQKNMQDPASRSRLDKYGWINETSITYQYNSHGFRCKEFDDEPCYLAFGCSHTEGVGLPVEQTWPVLLSTATNKPILNLGIGGSSFDTCVRILDHYIDKLNISGIFLLQPSHSRLELFNKFNFPENYLPSQSHIDKFHIYKEWVLSDKNIEYNVKKNTYSVRYLCDTKNIPCVILDIDTEEKLGNPIITGEDHARDLWHSGISTQRRISNLFCNLTNLITHDK